MREDTLFVEEYIPEKVFEFLKIPFTWDELYDLAHKTDVEGWGQLCRTRLGIQKLRISAGNVIDAVEKGKAKISPEAQQILIRMFQIYYDLEKSMDKLLKIAYQELSNKDPFIAEVCGVPGMGPLLTGQLLAAMRYPELFPLGGFPTRAKLWRFCGWAVIDGKAERRERGKKFHFSTAAKQATSRIVRSLISHSGPYQRYYQQTKKRLIARGDSEKSAGIGARRRTIKLFLSHFWERGRIAHGLPIRVPYEVEYLGHSTVISPAEFGWRD
jgi:hypothetical protein